ncbi:unnamed protein product, partial [Meganyctiphanes norvegica]
SPPANVKTMMSSSRTQLKQQLMRQQLQQQQEQKDKQLQHQQQQHIQQQQQYGSNYAAGALSQRQQQQQQQQQHQQHLPETQKHQFQPPLNDHQQEQQQSQQQQQGTADGIAIPAKTSSELPAQVLQVQTRLENPTYYHVLQSQRRQVRQFLSGGGSLELTPPNSSGTPPAWPHSDPGKLQQLTRTQLSGQQMQGPGGCAASAPRTLGCVSDLGCEVASSSLGATSVSTASCTSTPAASTTSASMVSSVLSSSATSIASDASEVEDVIDEILNLEEGLEVTDNLKVYDNNMPTTQLNSGSICDLLGLNGYMGKNGTPCSPEEPQIKAEATPVNDVQMVAFIKDRQKKDNHNMIERRRRYNINDRIKELATLLPRNNEPYFELVRDLRHNKGQILKASVDYIRRLKIDVDYNKEVEAKRRALEHQNRQLHLRIQELENQLRNNGINVDETTIDQSLLLSSIIKTEMVNNNSVNRNKNNTDGQSEMKKVRCSNSNITGSLLDQVLAIEDSSENSESDIDSIIGSALMPNGSMYLIPPGAPESPPYEFT